MKEYEDKTKKWKIRNVMHSRTPVAFRVIEELGYEKQVFHIDRNNSERFITYIKYEKHSSNGSTISFDCWNERICADTFDEDYEWNEAYYFTMQELQAINKKVQELGWKG